MELLKKMDNEDENAFIWRVCEHKDMIGTWQDVCNLLNKELNHEYNESWYRKEYQSFKRLFSAIKDDILNKEYLDELDDKLQEIEKERVRLRDERAERSKSIRIEARVENKLDLLEDAVKNIGKIEYNIQPQLHHITSDNDMIVILSDLHIGQTFCSGWGRYNSEVAKDRMSQYLSRIIDIQKLHNCENCYVSLQGDMISNSIHKTIAITNRENVIEQIILASEIISSFIAELSQHFNCVNVVSVVGNHSRIDRKEDALKDERLDSLIEWYAKAKLDSIGNVNFIASFDNTMSIFCVRDRHYVSVHGDYDKFDINGVARLSMMIGFIPYCILFGHKHFPATSEVNGVKLIQAGSIPGSGDDHTIELRLSGRPSQTVLICSENGIECNYTIELD